MTNSEKTSTTNNLSQHKYPKLKRQLQHDETDNALIAIRDAGFQNRDHSLRSTTAQDRRQKCASIPASSNVQHRYKLVSDWDSQWQAIYRHFTTCHQQRYPSSYQGSAATSHLLNKGSSDLPNLLTSTRLTPQVPSNQRNAALCNYYPSQQRTSHNSAISAASGANASIEDPLCYDQSMDITPDDTCDSYNGDCMSDYLPMNCTDPLIMSTVYMSSAASTTMADTNKRTSWYSEYLRSTLQRMHARTRNERKKTKSAPGGSVSLLTKDSSKQRTELCASATITYFSQRYTAYRQLLEATSAAIATYM